MAEVEMRSMEQRFLQEELYELIDGIRRGDIAPEQNSASEVSSQP
jgi:NTP pyrophosphatase (non-canonical NTP hydrolase)